MRRPTWESVEKSLILNRLKIKEFQGSERTHKAVNIEVSIYGARGDCGVDTKNEYVEILRFTYFTEYFCFNRVSEIQKEKELLRRVTVVIAINLDTGDTNAPYYESE